MRRLASIGSTVALAFSGATSPAHAPPEKLPVVSNMEQQLDNIPRFVDPSHQHRLRETIIGRAKDISLARLSDAEESRQLEDFAIGLREATARGVIYDEMATSPSTKEWVEAAAALGLFGAIVLGAAGLAARHKG